MANISFLLNHFPAGGVERVIMNLVPPLTYEKGHRVFIFVYKLNKDKLAGIDLPVTYIELPHRTTSKKNKGLIIESIRKYGIDLFFSPIISPKYIYELKKENVCKVCYVLHGVPFYELKEIRNSFDVRRKPEESITKSIKKHLLTAPKYRLGYYHMKVKMRYKKRYDKLDAFAVLNDNYKEQIAKAVGTSSEDKKLFTLQNPISPIDDINQDAKRVKRIIFVGRLSYTDKRVDRLLMVWEKLHEAFEDWELTIIGDGPEKHELKKIVQNKKLPRVTFISFTTHPEKYYKESEILCLTSDFEGCPMVLLEAQQHGCAAIAFDCSYGVRDILSPNWTNGVFIPNGDIDEYAQALAKLMEDKALRRTIQRNGLENVKRFSISTSVEQYDALINNICSENQE
jgi:glycosyltransferase involved in cell wall biosynthesis